MKRLLWLFLLMGAVLAAKPLVACLWDRDTLAMERERFPDAIELITGKFLRHSRAYYEWRVKACEAIIQSGRYEAPLLDDLAVAYEKLGNHEKAIETILKKEKQFPGLYETYANLGTFSIHSGELERGIKEIDRAIAINPDAHFGREIYQKLLVQYVLSKQVDGKTPLPLDENPKRGFADYLFKQKKMTAYEEASADELHKALKGVLGMMRFGNYDSPILLEALANLLLLGNESAQAPTKDGKRLAACAYLKASYESKEESTRQAYRDLAERALGFQTTSLSTRDQLSLEELEEVFKQQLAEAQAWSAELKADELAWIKAGKNPDEEFARKYDKKPALSTTFDGEKPSSYQEFFREWNPRKVLILLLCSIMVFVLGIIFFRLLRGSRGTHLPSEHG